MSDDVPPRPVWRNPWIIALVAGIVTITLLRPTTRHEPEAPPPIGEAPELRFERPDGTPFGTADLAGHPYVAGVIAGDCTDPACQAAAEGLAYLQKNYGSADLPIVVVTVRLAPAADAPAPSDVVLDAAVEQATPLLETMARLGETELDLDRPWDLGLMLVDGQGRVRGMYETDELGVDEALHRATHVLKEERAR